MKTFKFQIRITKPTDLKRISAWMNELDHKYLQELFNINAIPSKVPEFRFNWKGKDLLEYSESQAIIDMGLEAKVITYVENNYADSYEGLDALAKMLNLIYEIDNEYFPSLTSAQRILCQWMLLQMAFSEEFYDNVICELHSFTSEEGTDIMRDIVKTLYYSYINAIDGRLRELYTIPEDGFPN